MLTRAQKDQVEALAVMLYDAYNPDPSKVVIVPKDKCIAEAEMQLGFRERRYYRRRSKDA